MKFSKNARCKVKFKSQAAGRHSVNFNLLCSAKRIQQEIFSEAEGAIESRNEFIFDCASTALLVYAVMQPMRKNYLAVSIW